MEKNLPFVSFSLADKGYNKFIIPFLGKLDDGNVFKTLFNLIFTVLTFGLLIGGVYLSITELFGDDGYIESLISNDQWKSAEKAMAVLGLILGFAISLLTTWALFSFSKKRSEKVSTVEYDGLISYIAKVIPHLIILIGELSFLLLIYLGVLQFIASLTGWFVYVPLIGLPEKLLGILTLFPYGENFFGNGGVFPSFIRGNYDLFVETIKASGMYIFTAISVLVIAYVYTEIYKYTLKLATILVAFLPKFVIPLSIRTRKED